MEPWHIYALFFGVGVIVIVFALVIGEFGSDHDGFWLLSPLAIAAGLTAGGATGVVVEQTSFEMFSLPSALATGVFVYGLVIAAKRSLKKQESNSHVGPGAYSTVIAFVADFDIHDGERGVVSYTDVDRSRGTYRVLNRYGSTLPIGSSVVIYQGEDGELCVAPYES